MTVVLYISILFSYMVWCTELLANDCYQSNWSSNDIHGPITLSNEYDCPMCVYNYEQKKWTYDNISDMWIVIGSKIFPYFMARIKTEHDYLPYYCLATSFFNYVNRWLTDLEGYRGSLALVYYANWMTLSHNYCKCLLLGVHSTITGWTQSQ